MSSLLWHYETIDFDNCSLIDLVDTIIDASNHYYSTGNSPINDAQFDRLIDILKMGSHPGDGGCFKARDPEEAIALFLSEGDIKLFGEIFGEALINGEEKADGSFVLGDYIVRKI